ncbi:MAG: hypothetical protein JWM47_3948 [Acidimicrobiales bacterium]|nr:hypothetical protein [Acidimicrobiales bacterium]
MVDEEPVEGSVDGLAVVVVRLVAPGPEVEVTTSVVAGKGLRWSTGFDFGSPATATPAKMAKSTTKGNSHRCIRIGQAL